MRNPTYKVSNATRHFLTHCQVEKNLSPKTIKFYRIDLDQFLRSLGTKRNSDIRQISKNELRRFIESLSELKPKSIKRKVATLKSLFNFLEFDDVIEINPMRKIKTTIREAKKLPTVLELNEIEKMLRILYQKKKSTRFSSYLYWQVVRDIAIIELLFATGGRVSEVANLFVRNLNLDDGTVIIMGKGSKERIVQICNHEILSSLREYFQIWKEKINKKGLHFFINRLGNALSEQSIRNLVKNLSKKAGIQKHITPHVFRHSFATLLLEQDVDIKYIQTLLGHSSIMTTQIYTHVSKSKQKQLLETKHPRKNISFSEFAL